MSHNTEKKAEVMSVFRWRLSKRQCEIIKHLTLYGPKDCYDIKVKCKMHYNAVYNSIRRLEKRGFVWQKPEEKSKKGTRKIPYRLTLAGLAFALRDEELWNHIDEIMMKWSALVPLVFGKWKYFREKGLVEEATRRLKQLFQGKGILRFEGGLEKEIINLSEKVLTVKDYPYFFYDPLLFSWLLYPAEEGSMNQTLFTEFFYIPLLSAPLGFNIEEWFNVIRDDNDLKEWVTLFFEVRMTSHQHEVERFQEFIKKIVNSN